MKKFISAALSLMIIMIAAVTPLMTVTAATTTANDLKTASNWGVAKISTTYGATHGGEEIGNPVSNFDSSEDNKVVSTTEVVGDKTAELQILGNNIAFLKNILLEFEADKRYALSFKYYAKTNSGNDSLFDLGIIKDIKSTTKWNEVYGGTNEWGIKSKTDNKFINLFVDDSNKDYTVGNATEVKTTAGTWHNFTAIFDTGSITSALLYMTVSCGSVYFTDISFEEVEIPAGEKLATASNWVLAATSDASNTEKSANVALGNPLVGTRTNDSNKVTETTDVVGGKTAQLKILGNNHALFENTLLKFDTDKRYTLSFSYYANANTTEKALFDLGIIKNIDATTTWGKVYMYSNEDGAKRQNKENKLINVFNNDIFIGNVSEVKSTAQTWHTFTATFDSGSVTSALLYITVACGSLYLADISFEEVEISASEKLATASNWAVAATSDAKDGGNKGSTPVGDPVVATRDNTGDVVVANTTTVGDKQAQLEIKGTNNGIFRNTLIKLEAKQRYTLSFKYYVSANSAGKPIFDLGIIKDVNGETLWKNVYVEGNESGAKTKTDNKLINVMYTGDEKDFTVGTVSKVESAAQTWHTFTATFDTKDTVSALLYITTGCGPLYLTDLSLEKVTVDLTDEVAASFEYKGHSIRPTTEGSANGKAIRLKNYVKKSACNYGIDANGIHWDIIEYGFVAAKTDNFADSSNLVIGAEKSVTGIAYKTGEGAKDTVYGYTDDGISKIFTAALYGISNANINVDYTIRTYVKLKADGMDEQIVYLYNGEPTSIFAVGEIAFEATPDNSNKAAVYTDTQGAQWCEDYETRNSIYTEVLKPGDYTGAAPLPAQAAE